MSVYEIVTDKIIAHLENGTVPWRKPWSDASVPRSLATGKPYRGLNVFLLASADYQSPWWGTWNQVVARGGNVKVDETKKGTMIIFWKIIEKKERQDDGSVQVKKTPLLRYYRVWNLSQTENVKMTKGEDAKVDFTPLPEKDQNANAEAIIKGWKTGPRVRHDGGSQAFWNSATDMIHLPKRDTFRSYSGYYATRFHEMGHATGHESRLDRHSGPGQFVFASHAYGREELVAEMTSAFLMGSAGILQDTEENTAAYLSSWMRTIREDTHAVVVAASAAQRAADLVLNIEREIEA